MNPEDENEVNPFLLQFIELYKDLPELWNSSCTGYTNKRTRNIALDKLLSVYKNIKRDTRRKDVRNKINSLRSNFRREENRIKASLRSGAGAEVYTPTAWTYYALQFLKRTETPATNSVYSEETIFPAENNAPSTSAGPSGLRAQPTLDIPAVVMAWRGRLEQLEPEQQRLAVNAVNDILLQAELGNLGRYPA